jgi:hypothetical protein
MGGKNDTILTQRDAPKKTTAYPAVAAVTDLLAFLLTRLSVPSHSDLERTAATAALGDIRVIERESALFKALVPVDRHTVQ